MIGTNLTGKIIYVGFVFSLFSLLFTCFFAMMINFQFIFTITFTIIPEYCNLGTENFINPITPKNVYINTKKYKVVVLG